MSITTERNAAMPMKNPPHPGGFILRQCIEPLGLSVTAAAAALGVTRTTLSELVNARRGISPEMAVRLSKVFGGSAERSLSGWKWQLRSGVIRMREAAGNGWEPWSQAMKNVIEIDGQKAVVSLDPDLGMIRGEFLGLSGGADFYAPSVKTLKAEGRKSLKAYLEICGEKGLEPFRAFSGKFNLRLDPKVHEAAVIAAAAEDKSLNEWVAEAIEAAAQAA
jgi:addiction module HigA family antidote